MVGKCEPSAEAGAEAAGVGATSRATCSFNEAGVANLTAVQVLLIEVGWTDLQPTAASIRVTLETDQCGEGLSAPQPCNHGVATGNTAPLTIRVDAVSLSANLSPELSPVVYISVETGAVVQQSFQVAITAFYTPEIPPTYTALE